MRFDIKNFNKLIIFIDTNQKYLITLGGILLVLLFIFLRFYKLDQTLFFQNDIGRDFYVLENWRVSGKPPLLGPQNSTLPFNQSAIYYYYLFPFYILTYLSIFSTILAGSFLYIACFLIALFICRKHKLSVLIGFYLLTISPQIIFNTRYIFNPSLSPPLIFLGILAFLELKERYNKVLLLIVTVSLVLSVAISFVSIPIWLAFFGLSLWNFPKKRIQIIIFNCITLSLVFFPTLFFELRHEFLLTKSLIHTTTQLSEFGVLSKIWNLFIYQIDLYQLQYIGQNRQLNILILGLIVIVIFYFWIKNIKRYPRFKLVAIVWVISFILMIISPFPFNFYYILGLLTITLILISELPIIYSLLLVAILSILWLRPSLIYYYFQQAPRTVSDLTSCSIQICNEQKDPLFVSVQASHPNHSGLEFRYLLKSAGCDVHDIENGSQEANKMVVFEDQSKYVQGKTTYYELTLFGKSKETKSYTCNVVTSAHILVKN